MLLVSPPYIVTMEATIFPHDCNLGGIFFLIQQGCICAHEGIKYYRARE